MRRVRIAKAGGYDRLEIVEQASPTPGPGQVHVEVRAAGVSFADCVVRMGLYQSAREFVGWPVTPGFEFAGIVGAGAETSEFQPGERVFGVTRFGAYQTELVVDHRQLFRIPHGWTFEQASAFPVSFLSAWYALCELANPRPGARVLIHSAAGGVGLAAVQLAKSLGCEVVGVVGMSHKVEIARQFGCDRVIDTSSEPLWPTLEARHPAGIDVVLDPNGQGTLRASYDHLRPMGRLVIYGFQSMLPKGRGRPNWLKLAYTYFKTPRFDPLRMTSSNRSVMAFNLSYLFERLPTLHRAMAVLLDWVDEGRIRPLPTKSIAFERVSDAHRELESGTTTGRLVLTTGDGG
jgi:NADPH:quinone reductase-like Zn-dependent oxidoreductase